MSVHLDQRGAVLVVTIDRVERRNAIDMATSVAVAEAVDRLDADPELRAGVLTGAGGTFSSGMDLAALADGRWPEVAGRGLCGITRRPPVTPLVAAVEGYALAGGFELMLACDLVVAGQSATFGISEVKRGLVAGGGAALLLPRRIPPTLAMELLLTGATFGAERAAELGLVNRVVPEGQALEAAVELAEAVAANAPLAVAATKAIVRGSSTQWTLEQGWEAQNPILAPVFSSDDAREGARAFAERRAPVWRGR